jgi:hypothetical protein
MTIAYSKYSKLQNCGNSRYAQLTYVRGLRYVSSSPRDYEWKWSLTGSFKHRAAARVASCICTSNSGRNGRHGMNFFNITRCPPFPLLGPHLPSCLKARSFLYYYQFHLFYENRARSRAHSVCIELLRRHLDIFSQGNEKCAKRVEGSDLLI